MVCYQVGSEDILHALRVCGWIRGFGRSLVPRWCWDNFFAEADAYTWIDTNMSSGAMQWQLELEWSLLFCMVVRVAWVERNKVAHEDNGYPGDVAIIVTDILDQVTILHAEWVAESCKSSIPHDIQ